MGENPNPADESTTGRDSDPAGEPKSGSMPYLVMASVMLAATLLAGWFITTNINSLQQQNASFARFFVLLLLSLLAAMFLFGVLKATGKLVGNVMGYAIELGGPAALFFAIMVLGMQLVPQVENVTLNIALQPTPDQSMRAVSQDVTAIVYLEEQNIATAFSEVGMASIPSVSSSVVESGSVRILIQSPSYRVRADWPVDDDGMPIFKIGKGHRVEIPLERIPSPPQQFAVCRAPSNGIELDGTEIKIDEWSPEMGGGYDGGRWCNEVAARYRGDHPQAIFKLAATDEKNDSSCSPFNCPKYRYRCEGVMLIEPIYKLAASPDCGALK
jgi:hypothetical protein